MSIFTSGYEGKEGWWAKSDPSFPSSPRGWELYPSSLGVTWMQAHIVHEANERRFHAGLPCYQADIPIN